MTKSTTFNHLYLEIVDLPDAAKVMDGINKIFHNETDRDPFTCEINYSQKGVLLHIGLGTEGYFNNLKASKVFKRIVDYVTKTREPGSYEIEPNVGIFDLVSRELKKVLPFAR